MPRTSTAWRFRFPDLDAAEHLAGPVADLHQRVALTAGDAEIRQALLMLVSTTPGERVMRPEWGCDLRAISFLPNDATTAGLAMHVVRRAVERFEPRVEILRIDAGPEADRAEALVIQFDYRVRASDATATLRFGLERMADVI